MKRITVHPKVCAGCFSCVLKCSAFHYGASSLHLANLQITGDEATASFTPELCVSCEERSCVEKCPKKALSIDQTTGAVKLERDLCILCKICVKVCKYHGIRIRKDIDGKNCIGVCDLCGGDPQCVKTCRQGALTLEEFAKSDAKGV